MRASRVLAAGFALLALFGGSNWSLSQNLLRQAFGPSPQSETPQVQEEEAQLGTDVEAASSTEGTVQAEELTNTAPKETEGSNHPPSTEIAASPTFASAPVVNMSNLSAEPIVWSGPAQQPSQPALEQQPAPEQKPAKEKPVEKKLAKEKPAERKPAEKKPAKADPAKVRAVTSQVRPYDASSNNQNGGRIQKQ